jgi:DMSO/TMAO reductase YedYZ heme-binding membrane subunit
MNRPKGYTLVGMDIAHWFKGIRLYIGVATVLVAVEVWWWAQVAFGSAQLSVIRAQETYAWLALGCIILALLIGPLLKMFPGISSAVRHMLRESRRMIGVAAAFFAVLHASITYLALFRAPNPLTLATLYKQSFGLGVTALIILLLLAFTSFDKAFHGMGIWWFRLHRLIYAAVFVAVMHAFMVGSHASGGLPLILLGASALVLLGLHIYLLIRAGRASNWQIITITCAVIFAAAALNYGLTQHLGHNILLHAHDPGHNHG